MTAEPHVPYWCPTSKSVECCPEHSGWDVCCDKPELHVTGKLVRDKVPRRIYHGGGRPILHIASPEEYRQRQTRTGDDDTVTEYDSTADTLKHALRVGELMGQPIKELVDRSVRHDRSKTEDPELAIFNEFTPKLRDSTYGSPQYKGFLEAMGAGLDHHYAHNVHHPEHHEHGIAGMTLVDLIEMLADWRAATERHADGSLVKSLAIQRDRFGISDQLAEILWNTARHFRWLDNQPCGDKHTAPDGTRMVCNVSVDRPEGQEGQHADGHFDGGQYWWR